MSDDADDRRVTEIARLSNATIETKERKYRNVSVEVYEGWVKIDDREGETWVPRERVIDVASEAGR